MNTKNISLAQPKTENKAFRDNQVLTAGQLNQTIKYFDRQIRLSRKDLHGVGIVCGLKVTPSRTGFSVTQGCGVTTDGDLLSLDKTTTYNKYKDFKDENARYWFDRNTNERVWELIPNDIQDPEATVFSKFQANENVNPQNLAVVLYQEDYTQEPEDCNEVDCDNECATEKENIKVLLVSKRKLDAFRKLNPSTHQNEDQLAEVKMTRVELNGVKNISTLADQYKRAITLVNNPLVEQLSKTYQFFETVLASQYNGKDPFPSWKTALDKNIPSGNASDFQYLYDYFKDVIHAYDEFRECAYDLEVACHPDFMWFPKHLMLAAVNDKPQLVQYSVYRQPFIESPILNHRDERVAKLKNAHLNLNNIILNYNFKAVSGNVPVKITPSVGLKDKLSNHSIPYYYNYSKVQLSWNNENGKPGKKFNNLSYHIEKGRNVPLHASNPLDFCMDEYSFYRIEGHLGKPVREVFSKVDKIRREKNLGFDILPIQIEPEARKVFPGGKVFRFPELEALHKVYRLELASDLFRVNDYTSLVNDRVQKSPELESQQIETVPVKKFTRQKAEAIQGRAKEVEHHLNQNIYNFTFNKYDVSQLAISKASSELNNKIKDVTYTTTYTPLEKFTANPKRDVLQWLGDYLNKRKEKAKEQLTLPKFLEDHTGLEHHAGVEKGGTFIILYTANNQRVVGDFCLPYKYYEMQKDQPDTEDTKIPKPQPRPWGTFNDLKVDLLKPQVLNNKLLGLEQKANQIELENNSIKGEILVTNQSLTNSLIGTFGKGRLKVPGQKGQGRFGGIVTGKIDEVLVTGLDEKLNLVEELVIKERNNVITPAEKKEKEELIVLIDKESVEVIKHLENIGDTRVTEEKDIVKAIEIVGTKARNLGIKNKLKNTNSNVKRITAGNKNRNLKRFLNTGFKP